MHEYRGKTEEGRVGVQFRKSRVGQSHFPSRAGRLMRDESPSILPRGVGRHRGLSSEDPVQREFAAAVSQAMEGSLIRYSKRLELMALAERLGIGRFEANLLIAQVQQRTGGADEILIHESLDESREKRSSETQETDGKDTLFLLAALFIISALVDMVLVKIFFSG
jgi:hypothetical protein